MSASLRVQRLVAGLLALLALPDLGATPTTELESPAPVRGEFVLPDRAPWAGEVFELAVRWQVDWQRFNFLDGALQGSPAALVALPWGAPVTTSPGSDASLGEIVARTFAMSMRAGEVELDGVTQAFNLRMPPVQSGGRPTSRSETFATPHARLEVTALPDSPPGYLGAVGQFELSASLSANELAAGDTLAWSLTFSGRGNWPQRPAMPARRLPAAFVLEDAPSVHQRMEDSIFQGRLEETLLLTPTRPGIHRLPAVSVVTFDPVAGRYVTLEAPELTVTVLPGAAVVGLDDEEAAVDAGPSWLPRSGSAPVATPLAAPQWLVLLALPWLLASVLWLGLAVLHALQSDPWRQARRAHKGLRRLTPTLAGFEQPGALRSALRSWQRLTAQRWQVDVAAPTAESFPGLPDWAALWREADAVLYGGAIALPATWHHRAMSLLAQTAQPPPFSVARALTRKHLLPATQAVALLLWVTLANPALGSQADDVVPGDDWNAPYNHALALMEQLRWNEAAAFAAVSWVRSPGDSEALALWRRTAQEAGLGNHGVALPRQPLMVPLLGRSPVFWQWLSVISMAMLAGAGLWLLARAYGYVRVRPLGWGWVAIAAPAGLGCTMAGWMLASHGLAVSPDAVIIWREAVVRPIPIERFADAEAAVIAGGTLARSEQAVLGWHRLKLEDGRRSWVRREDLVWLWRDNPKFFPDYGLGHDAEWDDGMGPTSDTDHDHDHDHHHGGHDHGDSSTIPQAAAPPSI